jgi:hypothetical protein
MCRIVSSRERLSPRMAKLPGNFPAPASPRPARIAIGFRGWQFIAAVMPPEGGRGGTPPDSQKASTPRFSKALTIKIAS